MVDVPANEQVQAVLADLDQGRDFATLEPAATVIVNECLRDAGATPAEIPPGTFGAGPGVRLPDLYDPSALAATDGFGAAAQLDAVWFSAYGFAYDGTTPLFDPHATPSPTAPVEDEQAWEAAFEECLGLGQAHVDVRGHDPAAYELALTVAREVRERTASLPAFERWADCLVARGHTAPSSPRAFADRSWQRLEIAVQAHDPDQTPRSGPPELPAELRATVAELGVEERAAATDHRQCLESSGLAEDAADVLAEAVARAVDARA